MKQAGGAMLAASDANERASNNEREAELLRNKNLALQRQVLELREKLQWRHLSDKQKGEVRGEMSRFAGERVNLILSAGSPEIVGISTDLILALNGKKGAGWDVNTVVAQSLGMAVSGIVVEVTHQSKGSDFQVAKALVELLRRERLNVTGPRMEPDISPGGVFMGTEPDASRPINITIGAKP